MDTVLNLLGTVYPDDLRVGVRAHMSSSQTFRKSFIAYGFEALVTGLVGASANEAPRAKSDTSNAAAAYSMV